jgi:hypothetical protein
MVLAMLSIMMRLVAWSSMMKTIFFRFPHYGLGSWVLSQRPDLPVVLISQLRPCNALFNERFTENHQVNY